MTYNFIKPPFYVIFTLYAFKIFYKYIIIINNKLTDKSRKRSYFCHCNYHGLTFYLYLIIY